MAKGTKKSIDEQIECKRKEIEEEEEKRKIIIDKQKEVISIKKNELSNLMAKKEQQVKDKLFKLVKDNNYTFEQLSELLNVSKKDSKEEK